MKTIIIDPGHGGFWNGVYCTAGKRSPQVPPGFFEGVQVREIASELMDMAQYRYNWHSPLMDMPPNCKPDVSLKCRRLMYNRQPADLLLSLHTNAKGKDGQWKAARGTKLFFRNVKLKAANIFLDAYCSEVGLPSRGADRNSTFAILKSKHPAILIEMGFHTNQTDVEILKDKYKIASGIVAGLDAYFQQ